MVIFHQNFSFCWNLVKSDSRDFFSDCNQTYTENYGRISSPKWPNRTPPNIVCEFVINVPSSRTITVYPRIFRLRTHSNCTHSYLEVCTNRFGNLLSYLHFSYKVLTSLVITKAKYFMLNFLFFCKTKIALHDFCTGLYKCTGFLLDLMGALV